MVKKIHRTYNKNNNKNVDNRYKPYEPRTTNNGPSTNNSYIYNGRVLTGDPNNNNTNVFNNNNTRTGLTGVDPLGRPIGLTGNGSITGNTNIPKVEKDYPKSGESNIKTIIGIFIVTILMGVMYVYQNKIRKLNVKTKRNRKIR